MLPTGTIKPPLDDGAVWYRSLGTAPNRKLLVSWIGVRHADNAGPISFQAVLEETSNEILLAYQDTLHGNPAQDHGASATIGLESPDGTLGTQFLHNQPLLAPYQATTSLRHTNPGRSRIVRKACSGTQGPSVSQPRTRASAASGYIARSGVR